VTATLPAHWYTDPAVLEAEQEAIFRGAWQYAGRAELVAEPGTYLTAELGRVPVVIVRDAAGELRGFVNVCRHRAHRVMSGVGRCTTMQCPYHAWTYGLDGRLIGAPSTNDIENFDKGDWPLFPVAVTTWEGFLFINLAEEPEPFDQAWAPLLRRFSRFNLPNLKVARTIDYDVKANWKLLFQNYSECYHCGPVHPALAKLTPPTSGENDLTEGPFTGGYMVLNRGAESMTMSGQSCGLTVGELPEADMNRVYYYAIFPNMLLSLHPDYVMFHTLWPQGTDRTLINCAWLFHPDTLGDPAFNPDDGVEFWDITNRQDWHICEQSQLGVQSRAYTPGPYSKRESLSVQFDREVLRSLGHHVRK
jgi:Rieske 2Fe-2S family protein